MEKGKIFRAYGDKLKSKLYGLLCEREKNGEWEKYLDTINIEILGLESELQSINYYMLVSKLSFLKYTSMTYFRKTIFECMTLLDVVYGDNKHA